MSVAARAPKDLFGATRRILRPTLFPAGFFDTAEFASLDDLAGRLLTLAGERPLTYRPGAMTYDLWDDGQPVTFHAAQVYAGGEFIAAIADRWDTEAERADALAYLRARA